MKKKIYSASLVRNLRAEGNALSVENERTLRSTFYVLRSTFYVLR